MLTSQTMINENILSLNPMLGCNKVWRCRTSLLKTSRKDLYWESLGLPFLLEAGDFLHIFQIILYIHIIRFQNSSPTTLTETEELASTEIEQGTISSSLTFDFRRPVCQT